MSAVDREVLTAYVVTLMFMSNVLTRLESFGDLQI